MAATIATSVIGALCIAAVFAALKSRWLYVIAPRLYLNTPLSDGQIVSLTVTNVGLLAEEDVAVTLRPGCKFELIATSKSTLAVSGKTLSLPKLARAESVNVLLLVEGKSFEPSDIDSVESKATKGKVVETKEKATALWHSVVALPIVLLVLAAPFAFGTLVGSEMGVSAFQYLDEKLELFRQSKQLAGYKHELTEKYVQLSGTLGGAIRDKRIQIEIQEIVRRGDVLTVQLKIANNTKHVLVIEAHLEGPAGRDGPLSWTDSRSGSVALAPTESKLLRLKAYVPESGSVKLIQGSYNFKVPGGEELSVSQMIVF
jgi:hypothetical protein